MSCFRYSANAFRVLFCSLLIYRLACRSRRMVRNRLLSKELRDSILCPIGTATCQGVLWFLVSEKKSVTRGLSIFKHLPRRDGSFCLDELKACLEELQSAGGMGKPRKRRQKKLARLDKEHGPTCHGNLDCCIRLRPAWHMGHFHT